MKSHREIKPRITEVIRGNGMATVPDFKAFDKHGYDQISMGTRPSGFLHTGNLFVLGTAMWGLKINSQATVNVDVMDLDFHYQMGRVFTPFMNLPTTAPFKEGLERVTEMFGKAMGVDPERVKIARYSEKLTKTEHGRVMTTLLGNTESTDSLRYAVTGAGDRINTGPISLICPNCSQSASTFSAKDGNGTFKTDCNNTTCPVGEYKQTIKFGDTYNVHFIVDPIRDLEYGPNTLHIFGGDYGVPQGEQKMPRVNHVAAAVEVARYYQEIEHGPDFFVTPMLLDKDGRKISKSEGNAEIGTDYEKYLTEQVGKITKIIGEFVKGTLDGFKLTV